MTLSKAHRAQAVTSQNSATLSMKTAQEEIFITKLQLQNHDQILVSRLDHTSISKFWAKFKFKFCSKILLQNVDQVLASKFEPNLTNIENLLTEARKFVKKVSKSTG